jgi:hypothetical protein
MSSRRFTSSWRPKTRSTSAARRSGPPAASRCTSHAGGDAHAQYRVKRAPVIRNDRGPVGCTRNTASGPAGPLPPNVGWIQLKLCHASLCPWRDPGPSPRQVIVARSMCTRRPSTSTTSPARRRNNRACGHAATGPVGTPCPPLAEPLDRDRWPSSVGVEPPPPHALAPTASATTGGVRAQSVSERTRIWVRIPHFA